MVDLEELLRLACESIPAALTGSCVVFGSAPMALAGISKEVSDLDFFVGDQTFTALLAAGFVERRQKPDVPRIEVANDVEVFRTWPGVDFARVASNAAVIPSSRGFPVASLEDVCKSKLHGSRPKDKNDVLLILGQLKNRPYWRAAIHESGHAVADHLHGFAPISIKISDEGNGVTHCRDQSPLSATAHSFGVSCYAGFAAELVWGFEVDHAEIDRSTDAEKGKGIN